LGNGLSYGSEIGFILPAEPRSWPVGCWGGRGCCFDGAIL